VFLCDYIIQTPTSNVEECPLITKTARVMHEVADSDGVSKRVELGDMCPDVLINGEQTLIQLQNRKARKLL
jgi:hypothetical protein